MIQIIKWNEKVYLRKDAKIPDNPVDIMLSNSGDLYKIGEAELIENELGIFANNIIYWVNKELLDKIVEDSLIKYKAYLKEVYNTRIDKHKHEIKEEYDTPYSDTLCKELNLAYEYKKNKVEFIFLYKEIFTKENIKEIIRDLKINAII
jgi:hypothetical protein